MAQSPSAGPPALDEAKSDEVRKDGRSTPSENAQQESEDTPPKNLLLDLPPELRNRIYDLIIDENEVTPDTVKLPTLVGVCSQIRNDTLLLVCAKAPLAIHIGTDLHLRKLPVNQRIYGGYDLDVYPSAFVPRDIRRFNQKYGASGLRFRNISLTVFDLFMTKYTHCRPQNPMKTDAFVACRMDLKIDGDGKASCSNVVLNPNHLAARGNPWGLCLPELTEKDKTDLVKRIEKKANRIAGRNNFKGCSMEDLEKIGVAAQMT